MNTPILIAAVVTSFVTPIAFGQMYGGGYSQPQSQPPQSSSGAQQKTTTTTTKTVMPVGVKGYLDSQLASFKDKKFHEDQTRWQQSSTAVDMKGPDGKIYEIDFVLSGEQVTGASVGKVNGKSP